MKKVIAILLTMVILFSMAACGSTSSSSSAAPAAETKTEAPKAEEKAEPAPTEAPAPEEPKEEEAPAAQPKTYDELLAAAKAQGKTYKIGYLAKNIAVQWMQDMDTALEELSHEWGFEYTLYSAQGSIETQMNQLQTMLDQGVDGIITLVADPGMARTLVELAQSYDVPLMGEAIKLADADDPSVLVGPCIELSGALCGKMCAEWIFENYQKYIGNVEEDWSKVGFVTGINSTQTAQIDRSDGAWNTWKSLVPDFPDENRFIADCAGETSDYASATFSQMNAIIAAHPEIEYWLTCGTIEEYAQGIVRALQDNGLEDHSVCTSIGGEICTGLWENGDVGCWYACAYFEAMDCAKMCVQGLYDYFINGIPYNEIFDEWRVGDAEYCKAQFGGKTITYENFREFYHG